MRIDNNFSLINFKVKLQRQRHFLIKEHDVGCFNTSTNAFQLKFEHPTLCLFIKNVSDDEVFFEIN